MVSIQVKMNNMGSLIQGDIYMQQKNYESILLIASFLKTH